MLKHTLKPFGDLATQGKQSVLKINKGRNLQGDFCETVLEITIDRLVFTGRITINMSRFTIRTAEVFLHVVDTATNTTNIVLFEEDVDVRKSNYLKTNAMRKAILHTARHLLNTSRLPQASFLQDVNFVTTDTLCEALAYVAKDNSYFSLTIEQTLKDSINGVSIPIVTLFLNDSSGNTYTTCRFYMPSPERLSQVHVVGVRNINAFPLEWQGVDCLYELIETCGAFSLVPNKHKQK